MPDLISISVIIPSCNSQETIGFCLDALANQQTTVSYEIIVVDCSDDDQVQDICARYENIRFQKEQKRFSPGIGRNIGAKSAWGSLLVFLDSDVVLQDGALEKAWQSYQGGCRVFSGSFDIFCSQQARFSYFVEYYFICHQYQPSRNIETRKNLGAVMLAVDKALFESAGGFYDIARMQDTELTDRLYRRGHKLYFVPEFSGLIIFDSDLFKVFKKIFINGNNIYFIRYGEGVSFVKRVGLALLLPLAAFAKSTRIVLRNLRYQPPGRMLLSIGMIPVLYYCGFLWMLGFYRAVLFQKGISKQRS